MRILYVSRETPMHPAGGIATYIGYMAKAMKAAGHEVFLFTWTDEARPFVVEEYDPFLPENVHVERVAPNEIWRVLPVDSYNLYMSTWLSPRIRERVAAWDIDVIEGTDFLSPCLHLFQTMQIDPSGRDRLMVSYNHGFIEDFFEADQLRVDAQARINNLCERQQCRASDLVIAPSQVARDRLRGYGITDQVRLVREPYEFSNDEPFSGVRHSINYLGRIAISKGIDKLIYAANALHDVFPLKQVKLVGRVINTPFRNRDMKSYVLARLRPELRAATTFTGFLPRATAINMIEAGTIAPNLGSAETFSYACVESIDANLLPLVRHGTPMAEFFPAHLQDFILDAQMRSVRQLQDKMSRTIENAPAIMRDLRTHCAETLAPARIAEEMGRVYQEALDRKKGWRAVPVTRPMTLSDVTVLIPAYNPSREFMETVDSLMAQTAGIPRVLICNDGSLPENSAWFDYARAQLPDCRILTQPNSGLLAARNTLIEECESELAIFLDTDDLLAPDALQTLIDAWNGCAEAPDALIPQRRNFYQSGEMVLRHYLGDHLHILENDYRMSALIRTSVLRRIGFDATRRNGEADDWAFWLTFSGLGYKGLLVPYQLFLYRFHNGSMSWPWSDGQHVGSQTMVREALQEICKLNPSFVETVSRALYARNVSET